MKTADSINRPSIAVKLHCPTTGRYYAGRLRHHHGRRALVVLDRPGLLAPGQAIRVGMAPHPRSALLRRAQMLQAHVTQVARIEAHQTVAVEFASQHQLAASA